MLDFHVIDVNMRGSGLIIQTPSTNILIDLSFDTGTPKLINYIDSLGITHFDLLVITHPHRDHMAGQGAGGLALFLSKYTVDEIWSNGVPLPVWFDNITASPYGADSITDYDAYLNTIYSSGYTVGNSTAYPTIQGIGTAVPPYVEPRQGDTFIVGDLEIEVMNPQNPHIRSNTNEASIVLQVKYNGKKLLIMGDGLFQTEQDIINKYTNLEIKSDIYYMGHHGIDDATEENWFNIVNPDFITVQRRDHLLSQRIKDIINTQGGTLYDPYGDEDFYNPNSSNFRSYIFHVDSEITVSEQYTEKRNNTIMIKSNGEFITYYPYVKINNEYIKHSLFT